MGMFGKPKKSAAQRENEAALAAERKQREAEIAAEKEREAALAAEDLRQRQQRSRGSQALLGSGNTGAGFVRQLVSRLGGS